MCVQYRGKGQYQILMHGFLQIYVQKLQDTSMYNFIFKIKYFVGKILKYFKSYHVDNKIHKVIINYEKRDVFQNCNSSRSIALLPDIVFDQLK